MATSKFIVPVPNIEDREFTKPLLCGPGPCDLWPSVAEALTKPVITPVCDEFFDVSYTVFFTFSTCLNCTG